MEAHWICSPEKIIKRKTDGDKRAIELRARSLHPARPEIAQQQLWTSVKNFIEKGGMHKVISQEKAANAFAKAKQIEGYQGADNRKVQ